VTREQRDQQVRKVHKVFKEKQAQLVIRDQQDQLVLRDRRVFKEILVQRVQQDQQVHKVHRASKVRKANLVLVYQMAIRVTSQSVIAARLGLSTTPRSRSQRSAQRERQVPQPISVEMERGLRPMVVEAAAAADSLRPSLASCFRQVRIERFTKVPLSP